MSKHKVEHPKNFGQTGPNTNSRSDFVVTAAFFLLGTGVVGVIIVAGALIIYAWIASQLPSPEELRVRSHQFATTQILDREGNLLWEIIDPTGGRRTNVTLAHISPQLIQATLATEDRYFYLNVGVDPIAIVRAVRDNLLEQQIVSGASTITQQLARNVFLSPQEQAETSVSRKIKEAVLAIEISRRYSKDQILETYFNQIYYGNLAYGIEAAAQTYFGKPASALTLPEAAMLAGLPQSPATLDPYLNPEGAKARQATVLDLMVEAGYLSRAEAEAAKTSPLQFRDSNFPLEVPHFVTFVRQELERVIPPGYLYQAGLRVYTTIDSRLQAIAEEEVKRQIGALAGRNVTNGALVALDVPTGQILAMVGSGDYWNEQIGGQVNMVISPRQPASTMKPLVYLAAFERLNWTPSTLLMDTPVIYPEEDGDIYRPHNVDHRFHGPVSVRSALANSYNIPALKALDQVGIEALKEMAARMGITGLTRDDYGLSLALGSGEVSLLEMTGAYQAMANGGLRQPPTAILKITDSFGLEIEPVRPQARSVLRPEHSYLISHILADNEARTPAFGADSPLRLSRPAAAKTGTSNDFRDNWTIGYTPDIVAGVWVGNADNSPMKEVDGVLGAAPIWHNFMERAHADRPVRDFVRPEKVIDIEVCADSGTLPSRVCPQRRMEIFFEEQPPLGPEHDIHQLVEIDLGSGLRANQFCTTNVGQRYYQIYPADGQAWALAQGIEQPPSQDCPPGNIVANFTQPIDGGSMSGITMIEGSATAVEFAYYQLELGWGTNPQEFSLIQGPTREQVNYDLLGVFDTRQLENGPYTLRLTVFNQWGNSSQAQVRVAVENPDYAIVVQTPVTTPPSAYVPVTAPLTSTLVITSNGPTTVGTPEPLLLPGELTGGVVTAPITIPPQSP
jgi:1A family penicillin-binding protein